MPDAVPRFEALEDRAGFHRRHLGTDRADRQAMLAGLGYGDIDALLDAAVPDAIRDDTPLRLPPAADEAAVRTELRAIAADNDVRRAFIGLGVHGTVTPAVLRRGILEAPGWYTAYTPYQPEISQGRLEALLVFQTLVTDLTGTELAGASLLDEATAAAEGVALCRRVSRKRVSDAEVVLIDRGVHPQTVAVVVTRARALGLEVHVTDLRRVGADAEVPWSQVTAALLQSPTTDGVLHDDRELIDRLHAADVLVTVATDLLACTLVVPPGEQGADVVVGSAQRLGVPMFLGGPHAAFLATRESWARQLPGRLVGVSVDVAGRPALRLALQTREQHIRRERATSNVCTSQVLLAVLAGMYGVHHGPEGLTRIARRIHALASVLRDGLAVAGYEVIGDHWFDTVTVIAPGEASDLLVAAARRGYDLGRVPGLDGSLDPGDPDRLRIALDETATAEDVAALLALFSGITVHADQVRERASWVLATGSDVTDGGDVGGAVGVVGGADGVVGGDVGAVGVTVDDVGVAVDASGGTDAAASAGPRTERSGTDLPDPIGPGIPDGLHRRSPFLTDERFHRYRSETALMRWLRELAARDIALDRSMIPLGSCTMKLNAATELEPISWPAFAELHPYAPLERSAGLRRIIADLEGWLAEITGYDAVSLQPNAGAQGELAGLLAIRGYHRANGDHQRTRCLIPSSAHGTNAASAVMAGLRVEVVACDAEGNVDLADLRRLVTTHADELAAVMITYPSTHGVFEAEIRELCDLVHAHGGQVYLDGANLNALVGIARPGRFGADVSHLNLHKTFCIPHGGGGPGVGPVACREHLAPFLPTHPLVPAADPPDARFLDVADRTGPISGAPWGSAGILPIAWTYLRLMGPDGLRAASETAILAANHVARRLAAGYPVLYTGPGGLVAHEAIIDVRSLRETAGLTNEDVAKRLIDHGFHAPTMSFPVAGTLMVEPTESESLTELDRFCDAMLAIRAEAARVEAGEWPRDDNPLVNAPHTAEDLLVTEWARPYTRTEAAYPSGTVPPDKYWPPVGRIDNAHGDRNLVCACPPLEAYRDVEDG